VLDNTDCCDSDSNARPGQTLYYSSARNGCGGYDYNCDGVETREFTQSFSMNCNLAMNTCTLLNPGWYGAVPVCGDNPNWVHACEYRVNPNGQAVCALMYQFFPSAPRQTCR
jgi:hypothetical protein